MNRAKNLYRILRAISPGWCTVGSVCICITFFVPGLDAQNKYVHGLVVSQLSKEKIPYASIYWKRAGTGKLSDSIGAFTIYSKYPQDTLIVSHVGYITLYISFDQDRDSTLLILELKEKMTKEKSKKKSKKPKEKKMKKKTKKKTKKEKINK